MKIQGVQEFVRRLLGPSMYVPPFHVPGVFGGPPRGYAPETPPAGSKRVRREPCPIGQQFIAPGQTYTLVVAPAKAFRADRLMLVDSLGYKSRTMVMDVLVGQRSCFIGHGEIPIQCFRPSARDGKLSLETVSPGIYFQVTLQNRNSDPVWVGGCFFGESIEL